MIHSILDFLRSLTTPDGLRHILEQIFSGWLGYAALCGIVFSETGLLVGFFLPGDSLLFTVGVVAGDGGLNIVLVNVLLSLARCWAIPPATSSAPRRQGDLPPSRFALIQA